MTSIRDPRYYDRKGVHSYDVEVFIAGSSKERATYDVIANNRDQAARIVERDGQRKIEALKIVSCGGCGQTDPIKRCVGCVHDFGDASSAWVRSAD